MRRAAALLGVALTITLLGGCGGSDRLSSSDLTNQASQICALANQQLSAVKAPAAPAGSTTFLRQGITVLTPEIEKLRKLRPPADAQDVYNTATDSAAKKLALLRTAAGQIAGGGDPVSTMQGLEQQLSPVVTQENQAWQSLGIAACESH